MTKYEIDEEKLREGQIERLKTVVNIVEEYLENEFEAKIDTVNYVKGNIFENIKYKKVWKEVNKITNEIYGSAMGVDEKEINKYVEEIKGMVKRYVKELRKYNPEQKAKSLENLASNKQ